MVTDKKTAAIEAVETLIQYKFKETELLWEALNTGPVASLGQLARPDGDGNKRLAVIGDSVLQLALAEDWYKGGTSRGMFCPFEAMLSSNSHHFQDTGLRRSSPR